MRGMTDKAVLELLPFHMRLMAVEAAGNGAVYLCMTALAVYLCIVEARELGKLSPLALVADCADNYAFLAFYLALQFGELDYLGRMGLLMAIHAVREILAMRKVMAILALRHDFVPIILSRIVGMVLLMAVGAGKLMLAAFFLQPFELIIVASAAIHRGERLDVHFI